MKPEQLDLECARYIKHALAGKVMNIEGCVQYLKEGKTHFSDGQSVLDALVRDTEYIKSFIYNLEKKSV